MINNNIKLLTKISAKSISKWFTIIGTGASLSIVSLITSIVLLYNANKSGANSHDHAMTNLIPLLTQDYWPVLLFISSFLFLFLYVAAANKIAMTSMLYFAWETKSTDFISPVLSGYLQKIFDQHTDWVKGSVNASTIVKSLVDLCRNDKKLLKVQRKIISYCLKKIRVENLDLSDKNLNLSEVIVKRVLLIISEAAKPSMHFFWIVTGTHSLLLMLAILFSLK